MSTPNNKPSPEYPPLQTRLKYAIVPVVVLMGGYVAVMHYYAGRVESETLARLPERPAVDSQYTALASAIDQALAAVHDEPTADHVGHLGKVYQANGYDDEAAACYRRAMELDNTNAQWPYLLARSQGGDGSGGDALALLHRTLELEPTYVPAILRRADARYASGDLDGAQTGYLRCLDLEMDNAWARLGMGRIALDREDWPDAENQLRMAVTREPDLAAVYPLLALACEKQGKETEAQQAREAAVALDGAVSYPDPWVDDLIAFCYDTEQLLTSGARAEAQGQWDEAQWAFQRVLEVAPDNVTATVRMGVLLQRQGHVEAAGPVLQRALALAAPGDADHARVNAHLGNNYLWQQQPEEAVTHYVAALASEPDLEAAHQGLAACYLELAQFEQAAVHAEAAAALNPASHEAHYNWGQALLNLGREDAALGQFSEATRLNPTLPPAEYMAGAFYFKHGNMEKAVPYLERAEEQARARGDRRLEERIRTMLGRPE